MEQETGRNEFRDLSAKWSTLPLVWTCECLLYPLGEAELCVIYLRVRILQLEHFARVAAGVSTYSRVRPLFWHSSSLLCFIWIKRSSIHFLANGDLWMKKAGRQRRKKKKGYNRVRIGPWMAASWQLEEEYLHLIAFGSSDARPALYLPILNEGGSSPVSLRGANVSGLYVLRLACGRGLACGKESFRAFATLGF